MSGRRHRHEAAYPSRWRAVVGAIRDAMHCHPDIVIPERRIASIAKRVIGAELAVDARAARAGAVDPAAAERAAGSRTDRPQSGASGPPGAEGAGSCQGPAPDRRSAP